jgi:hypothetical protein
LYFGAIEKGRGPRDEGSSGCQVPPKDGSVRSPVADSGVRSRSVGVRFQVSGDKWRGVNHCSSLPLDTRHSVLGNLKPGNFVSTHRADPQFLCKTSELSYRLHAEFLHDAGSVGFNRAFGGAQIEGDLLV